MGDIYHDDDRGLAQGAMNAFGPYREALINNPEDQDDEVPEDDDVAWNDQYNPHFGLQPFMDDIEDEDLGELFNELRLVLETARRDGNDNSMANNDQNRRGTASGKLNCSMITHSEYYEGAAKDFGTGLTFLEKFKQDKDAAERVENPYFPMESFAEWEFTNKFMQMHCSQAEKTELLDTELVSDSFRNDLVY